MARFVGCKVRSLLSGPTWINDGEAGQVSMLCDASICDLVVTIFAYIFFSYLGVYQITTSTPTMPRFGKSDVTSGGVVGGQNGLALLVVNDAEAHCAAPWKRTLLQRGGEYQFAVTTGAATALSSSPDRRCVGGVYKVLHSGVPATGAFSAKVRLPVSCN